MQVESLIQDIVTPLRRVDGIRAIVLGGSRARGMHTSSSDIDVGIYYHPGAPLNITQLSRVAADLDDGHREDLVTAPGGWGPWINGGGWLQIRSQAVDFLYRDLAKVTKIIDDCLQGM